MSFPTFSIITPVYIHNQARHKMLARAVGSVKNQSYEVKGEQEGLWEHIVVNDGSPTPCELPEYPWLKVLKQKHLERLYAANLGFKEAKNEWFVLLDSDDMLSPYYLEACSWMIKKFPNYKVFNFGSVHFHPDCRVSARGTFEPKVLEKGHEMFGGGKIVKGTFIFHRSCYEKLGGFPECTNPWDFSEFAQKTYPEIKPYFTVEWGEKKTKIIKELGNPMGDDFFLFYKLTREYHSKPIPAFLYMAFHKGKKGLRV